MGCIMSKASDDLRDLFIEVTGETEPLTEEGEDDNERLAAEDEQIDVDDGLDDAVSGGEFDQANQFE